MFKWWNLTKIQLLYLVSQNTCIYTILKNGMIVKLYKNFINFWTIFYTVINIKRKKKLNFLTTHVLNFFIYVYTLSACEHVSMGKIIIIIRACLPECACIFSLLLLLIFFFINVNNANILLTWYVTLYCLYFLHRKSVKQYCQLKLFIFFFYTRLQWDELII